MSRLALWWRRIIDRERHHPQHAAWLAERRRELAETERELKAHVASWAPIYAGDVNVSEHPAHSRTRRLQARIRDLRAVISEHA